MNINEDKLENTPTGGALIGKRKGQTMIHNKGSMSGYLVGKTHAEGGIKAINKSTGQPLEMQGGEVVITAPAVSDQSKHNFDGKMMTNREILSTINERGGGVSFAKDGMEIPKNIKRTGANYNYGGKTMTDHEIYKYITGGGIAEEFSIRDIADIHQIPLAELKQEVRIGMLAESEHKGDKKDQMEIVKDHLFENPKYYTLLKKAGLVEEKKSVREKSKWLQTFYVTNNPSIDKFLKDLQPKIEELIEKQKELVIKETTKVFGMPRPMTETDIQFYEAGLIFKMVQAFNKYLKNTDELYDVSINKRGGLFEVNSKVKRDNRTYKFDTELIGAGGYNIQEYHYRYIIKTDLPFSNENSAVENIKAKMGVLKKIRTIDEDIARYTKNIERFEQENIDGFVNWNNQIINLSADKIEINKRYIQDYHKDIKKLEVKKADLISVFESLDKKGVGVNFGKQVKEAIGSRILVDRLRGSKYKETGDTLDFKIENRIIKGKDLGDRRIEILGNINSFSFIDEGNGLCTMKAGLELRGKYTPYAEYKNLPLKEIPYKINEIFNGEFEKYLQYEDGGDVEEALNDLEKAPSVKFWFEPSFNSESYFYPENGEPNSFVNLTEDSVSKTIIAYDDKGKLVGVFKISTKGDLEGAFKIVVREDATRQGYGKKLLDEAEKQNIDIVGNVKNNSFSSTGRDLLRSWLNKKSKQYKDGGEVDKEDLVKDSKSGNTPARDLNNYNDLMDVGVDGEVGGNTGLFATGGGVDKKEKSFESEGSTEGKGKLYEFFTPQVVADKMLALAQHYGFKGGNVLEPATGSGRLIKNLKDTNITAFEISKDNFEILKREFPNAELYNFNFEKAFLKEPRFNTLLNRKGTETWLKGAPFDLVLANPPYGKFSGLYSSYFKFKGQVEHFFILQTLYLLKKGGLAVYLIPSSFLRNGLAYNDIKKQIFEIAEFVDAYRLPSNIFEKTQIGTDILILRKK